MMRKNPVIISLGGSLIAPDEIDTRFLNSFKKLIIGYVKKGYRFVIICGGGSLNRKYIRAAKKIGVTDFDLQDWIGIAATHLNARFVWGMFGNVAEKQIVTEYKGIKKGKKSIMIGGGWRPGRSTDFDAVLMAKIFDAGAVINMSDIDYVYNADPDKNPRARPIKQLSWSEYQKIVGPYRPRGSWPFDPIASKLAKKSQIRVVICNGRKLGNLRRLIEGKKNYIGTTIE
jgi:uridylate kinase